MFFIREENVRPGNRGGRSLFNWNDIRLMNNKDRESYLGVTQSIGFLDKGGKWRKRDWWLNYKLNDHLNNQEISNERERIRKDEEKVLREKISGKTEKQVTKKEEALTEYEWKELMKKEANFNVNDNKLLEFYDNDEHKPGLGIKSNISFRTNPYDKNAQFLLTKLEGNVVEKKKDLSAYLDDRELSQNKINNNDIKIIEKIKKSSRSRSRSKSKKHKKEKKDKKHKKDKKDKKDKKHKNHK